MHAIETKGLTHSYQRGLFEKKKQALTDLDLTVEEGEIFGFLGANGAGKTTTIKILVGLQIQTAGSAAIFGISTQDTECRRLIGFMPENPYFYEYLTARESLDFYGALCDLPSAGRKARIDELLTFVGLSEAADVRLKEFSKGMRQRLGIAQAIVHRPRLVILDEPMSGLDPLGRRQVREAILELGRNGTTVFFSSHILSDVEMICDRAALLDRGHLVSCGPLSKLLEAREEEFEVGVEGLSGAEREEVARSAKSSVVQGDGVLFIFDSREKADKAAREAVQKWRLVLYRPIKESLEEYFMRTTGKSKAEIAAWSGGQEK